MNDFNVIGRVVIIEDNDKHAKELCRLIEKYYPGLNIMAICADFSSAVSAINNYNPNLIFLDVELKGDKTGYDVANAIQHPGFQFIVTSAKDSGIKAVKVGAKEYLLKPFNEDEFVAAINNWQKRLNPEKGKALIFLPVLNGLMRKFNFNEIIRFESKRDHSILISQNVDDNSIIISWGLSDLLNQIKSKGFNSLLQTHRQHVVNLHHIQGINKSGSQITMVNNDRIPVSSKEARLFLLDYLNKH